MGVNPGSRRKAEKRLPSMSITLPEPKYEPPPEPACETYDLPVAVDDDGCVRLFSHQRIYKGKVVHFAVMIHVRDHAFADWTCAYKIDTSHGTVHYHQYYADESPRTTSQLATIPAETGEAWDFVTEWFSKAMDMCEADVEVRIQTWRRGAR